MITLCRWLTGIGIALLTVAAVLALAFACATVDPGNDYIVVPGRGVQTIPAPGWRGGGP